MAPMVPLLPVNLYSVGEATESSWRWTPGKIHGVYVQDIETTTIGCRNNRTKLGLVDFRGFTHFAWFYCFVTAGSYWSQRNLWQLWRGWTGLRISTVLAGLSQGPMLLDGSWSCPEGQNVASLQKKVDTDWHWLTMLEFMTIPRVTWTTNGSFRRREAVKTICEALTAQLGFQRQSMQNQAEHVEALWESFLRRYQDPKHAMEAAVGWDIWRSCSHAVYELMIVDWFVGLPWFSGAHIFKNWSGRNFLSEVVRKKDEYTLKCIIPIFVSVIQIMVFWHPPLLGLRYCVVSCYAPNVPGEKRFGCHFLSRWCR